MRKTLLPILALVLAALAYAAWPVWSAWQLRAAVKSRDLAGIERRVDWPQLRENLKRTIAANLQDDKKGQDDGLLARTVKRTLGPIVANRLIDVTVTPRTLAHVLAGRLLTSEIKRDVTGGGAGAEDPAEAAEAAANDPLSPRRLRWAFFESPTRFRIEVTDRAEPAKRVVSVFALQGVSWKLVDVYYRSPT
jgi:hypothetical protein